MTHAKDPAAIAKEARLEEAIAAVKNKKHTLYSAARVFDVPATRNRSASAEIGQVTTKHTKRSNCCSKPKRRHWYDGLRV